MKKFLLMAVMPLTTFMLNAQVVYTNLENSPIVMDAQYVQNNELGYAINLMGGNEEFYIQNYAAMGDEYNMPSYFACFERGTMVAGQTHSTLENIVLPLSYGTSIGGNLTYVGNTDGNATFPVIYDASAYTDWQGQTKFVGFKFTNSGNTYYG